jgi:type IV pilus assembly protein PilW
VNIQTLRARAAHPAERGFNLVELMVASTIAMFMLIGVANLYLSSLSSEKTNTQAAEITSNGRYAIDVLRRDLLHAGFRGITWAAPSPVSTGTPVIANECIGTGFVTNIRQGIWGANDSDPFAASCIPAAAYSRGDVLVVRHADYANTTTVNVATTVADRITATNILTAAPNSTTMFFRSAYERGEVFEGLNSAALFTTFTQAPSFDYKIDVNVYYISPFTVAAGETPLVPALWRVKLDSGPAMTRELVASNIENMQVRYGRLTTDLNTRFYHANAVSATANSTTTTPSEWDAVNSVRIWLLVRSTNPEVGYVNANTYTLGDVTVGPFNDGYRREIYSTVVQLRNI